MKPAPCPGPRPGRKAIAPKQAREMEEQRRAREEAQAAREAEERAREDAKREAEEAAARAAQAEETRTKCRSRPPRAQAATPWQAGALRQAKKPEQQQRQPAKKGG